MTRLNFKWWIPGTLTGERCGLHCISVNCSDTRKLCFPTLAVAFIKSSGLLVNSILSTSGGGDDSTLELCSFLLQQNDDSLLSCCVAPGIIVRKMIFKNTPSAHNIFCFCDFGVFTFCDFACAQLVEHCLGKPRPRNHKK